jgi:hypothetical protein
MRNQRYYYRVRLIAYTPTTFTCIRFPPCLPSPSPTPLAYYQRIQRRPLRKILLIKQERTPFAS